MDPISFSSCPGSSYKNHSFLLCQEFGGPKFQVLLVDSGDKGCVGACSELPPGFSGLVWQGSGVVLV